MKHLLKDTITVCEYSNETNNAGQHDVIELQDVKCRLVKVSKSNYYNENDELVTIRALLTTNEKIETGTIFKYGNRYYIANDVTEWKRASNKIFGYHAKLTYYYHNNNHNNLL